MRILQHAEVTRALQENYCCVTTKLKNVCATHSLSFTYILTVLLGIPHHLHSWRHYGRYAQIQDLINPPSFGYETIPQKYWK
jgi:hypothetical protein